MWAAYSPVKNSPADAAAKAKGGNPSHSATTGELDTYHANCRVRLRIMQRALGFYWRCKALTPASSPTEPPQQALFLRHRPAPPLTVSHCRGLVHALWVPSYQTRLDSINPARMDLADLCLRVSPPSCLQMLAMLGAKVDPPQPVEFNGISGLELWPRVSWSPLWAVSFDDVEAKVGWLAVAGSHSARWERVVACGPATHSRPWAVRNGSCALRGVSWMDVNPTPPVLPPNLHGCCHTLTRVPQVAAGGLHLGTDTTLVISAPGTKIRALDLERGTLVVEGVRGAEVAIDGLKVDNAGWQWQALDSDSGATEEEYIRGFRVVKHEQLALGYRSPGSYTVT